MPYNFYHRKDLKNDTILNSMRAKLLLKAKCKMHLLTVFIQIQLQCKPIVVKKRKMYKTDVNTSPGGQGTFESVSSFSDFFTCSKMSTIMTASAVNGFSSCGFLPLPILCLKFTIMPQSYSCFSVFT